MGGHFILIYRRLDEQARPLKVDALRLLPTAWSPGVPPPCWPEYTSSPATIHWNGPTPEVQWDEDDDLEASKTWLSRFADVGGLVKPRTGDGPLGHKLTSTERCMAAQPTGTIVSPAKGGYPRVDNDPDEAHPGPKGRATPGGGGFMEGRVLGVFSRLRSGQHHPARQTWLLSISFVSTMALVFVGLGVAPAAADATPDCALSPVTAHCYSILQGSGTTFYGMSGTWFRESMNAGVASAGNPLFMDSEMWFGSRCGYYWVEEGLFQGYEPKISHDAYEIFYAWRTTGGVYNYQPIAYVSPNSSVDDDYAISNPTSGVWDVWWDGNLYNTPNVGFNSGACLQMGAEVATPNGCARTFTMDSQAYNSSDVAVNWGTQAAAFSPPGIGGVDLNGISYHNSDWSWNTVVNNGRC